VSFDAEVIGGGGDHGGDAIEGGFGAGVGKRRSAVVETGFAEGDDKAIAPEPQGSRMGGELRREHAGELALEAAEILLDLGRCGEIVAEGDADGGRRSVRIIGRGGVIRGRCGGKESQRLKGGLDGVGDLDLLLLVGTRTGLEYDEEGKEQGDEVRVGNQPAVAMDVIGGAAEAQQPGFHARFSG
jgi:hypothetical protein